MELSYEELGLSTFVHQMEQIFLNPCFPLLYFKAYKLSSK